MTERYQYNSETLLTITATSTYIHAQGLSLDKISLFCADNKKKLISFCVHNCYTLSEKEYYAYTC